MIQDKVQRDEFLISFLLECDECNPVDQVKSYGLKTRKCHPSNALWQRRLSSLV